MANTTNRSGSSELQVTAAGVRLPDKSATFIILSNRNYEDGKKEIIEPSGGDNYRTAEKEIYWGYSGETPHPLFPGDTTILLPVKNASDIYLSVRVGSNPRFVAYSIIL